MPTPTIPDGKLFMNATLYTGTGASLTVANAGNFQPDLVWFKNRSNAQNNHLMDVNRGGGNILYSNLTNSEDNLGTSWANFTSTGFSIGADSGINNSGQTFVAWQWKAGGAAVTNTAGTISAQVSANPTAGFSIVTWVHSSTTSTIGHGLGVAPSFIILKSRTTAYNWDVGCNSIGWANRLILNSTGATTSGFWNSTAPTSSVFTYAGSGASNGDNMVAYCWAPIAGYSAFGSYTGNGSTDGPFVYLGFRPRYIMIKSTVETSNWFVYDTARDTYNTMDSLLFPSDSGAEYTDTGYALDSLSNGFKIRATGTYGGYNNNGNAYIYACFAENPFKYANAR